MKLSSYAVYTENFAQQGTIISVQHKILYQQQAKYLICTNFVTLYLFAVPFVQYQANLTATICGRNVLAASQSFYTQEIGMNSDKKFHTRVSQKYTYGQNTFCQSRG